jgi:hypothetical protein
VAVARAAGARPVLARSLIEHANVCNLLALREEAAQAGEQAVQLAREMGDEWTTAMALYALAVHVAASDSLATARPLADEATAILLRLGDRRHVAAVQSDLGYLALLSADFAAAHTLIAEAVELSRELRDPSLLAYALGNRGVVAVVQGEDEPASAALHETLVLCRAHELRGPVPEALAATAVIAARAGDHDAAGRLSGAAYALRGVTPSGVERELHESARREVPDDDAWTDAHRRGAQLGFSDAITLGLRASARPPTLSTQQGVHRDGSIRRPEPDAAVARVQRSELRGATATTRRADGPVRDR